MPPLTCVLMGTTALAMQSTSLAKTRPSQAEFLNRAGEMVKVNPSQVNSERTIFSCANFHTATCSCVESPRGGRVTVGCGDMAGTDDPDLQELVHQATEDRR